MEVAARQLNSPQLSYRNNKGQPQTVNTQDGAWMTKNLRGYRAGAKVTRWIVVVFAVSRWLLWQGCGQDGHLMTLTPCRETTLVGLLTGTGRLSRIAAGTKILIIAS